MAPVLALGALLLWSQTACALECTKLSPVYAAGQIPKFTGGPGPFGRVCEVKRGKPFPHPPSVPTNLNGQAFVVRTSFPDNFMETSMASVTQAIGKSSQSERLGDSTSQPNEHHSTVPVKENVSSPSALNLSASATCGGGMSVRLSGAAMDEQVQGIQGGTEKWLGGCISCGRHLQNQGSLAPGWYCKIGRFMGVETGIWLKRLADTSMSSVEISLTPGHEILGFGGAFTDAVAVANDLLDVDLQTAWLGGYYGDSGAGFSIGRVPFGGCDFSRRAYSLDEMKGDLNLTHMCLQDDRESAKCGEDAKVPIIKKAVAQQPALRLFFSPWSAPSWMKTTGKFTGGKVRGVGAGSWSEDDKNVADAYANSFVKFVDLYAEEGIKLWGLTLQNEPGADQYVTWNSAALTGEGELALLNLVGPKMRKKYPDLKIMVHDDQVYSLKKRLTDDGLSTLSSEYVDGVAYHWYGSLAGTLENITARHATALPVGPADFGGGIQVKEIFDQHIRGTRKFMLATEACTGFVVAPLHLLLDPWSVSNYRGVRPGDWHRGYRYSRDIFNQLVNGASGWTDWNLILRSDGGPNWAGNNVDAPILVSPDGSALWVSPMFFHLAHWSKYITPGSRVLAVDSTSSKLHEVAAFLRPDQRIVVVALCDQLDGHGDPPASQVLQVSVAGLQLHLDMLSSSIATAVFDVPQSDGQHQLFV